MGTHNKLVRSEDDTVFMMRERICRIAEKDILTITNYYFSIHVIKILLLFLLYISLSSLGYL